MKYFNSIKLGQILNRTLCEPKRYFKSTNLIYRFIFIMAMFGKRSGLQMDQTGRMPCIKKFFGVRHYSDTRLNSCVVSDTTIAERLEQTTKVEFEKLNYSVLKKLQKKGEISRTAIIDGSQTCGDYGSYLGFKTKYGGIFLVDYESSGGLGKELQSSKEVIKRVSKNLEKKKIDLLLLDMLYLNSGIFGLVKAGYVKNILVKYTPKLDENNYPKLYRNVLKRFETYLLLKGKNQLTKTERIKFENCGYNYEKGYDKERLVEYEIFSIARLDTDNRFKIAKIFETNVNGKQNLFYVFTTDFEMSGNKMRENGHNRWIIENNGFKMLNNLVWSKHQWYRNPMISAKLILIFQLSFSLLWLFRKKYEKFFTNLFPGAKITTKMISEILLSEINNEIFFDSA